MDSPSDAEVWSPISSARVFSGKCVAPPCLVPPWRWVSGRRRTAQLQLVPEDRPAASGASAAAAAAARGVSEGTQSGSERGVSETTIPEIIPDCHRGRAAAGSLDTVAVRGQPRRRCALLVPWVEANRATERRRDARPRRGGGGAPARIC